MNDENESFYLTSTPVKKLLIKFSIPCILAMLVSALYNIVDQIFIGNSTAGTAGIMATTLVFPITVVALAIAQLVGDGCAALYSISLGTKDKEKSDKAVGNAIIAIITGSLLLVFIGFILKGPVFNLLGVNGYSSECQEFTSIYYNIILIGMPFYMFASAMSSVIRASGAPKYSMISTLIGAVINIILDPIFIFIFDMGVTGAAIATIIGQIVSAVLAGFYFRKPKLIKLTKDKFKIDGRVLGKLLQLGISSFITQISIAIITIVANNVVGTIGGEYATDAGGALGIVFKVFAIILAFSLGVAVGGQPIIGFNYGAKKYKRVLETYKLIFIANIIIGLVATFLFEVTPNLIVNLFGGNASNIEFYQEYARLSFQIYLGGMLFCCIQKSSCIFLQSIDKPYKAMILSLMRDVVLLVPGVLLLGVVTFNTNGGNSNEALKTMLWAGPIADIGSVIVTIILVSIECLKIKNLNTTNIEIEAKDLESNKYTITIGREYGSGGKYIGEQLAKRLGIKCYDDELLQEVSKDYDIDIHTLESVDEKQKSDFWYSFATNYVFNDNNIYPISAEDNLFLKQAKVIEEISDREESIIIGRCSDYILNSRKNIINVFIYASDINFRIKRKIEFEKLSEKDAIKMIEKIDRQRADYYEKFTSQKWGNKNNYDICIDTSRVGIDGAIDIIGNYIENLYKINIK